jgi:hypothetical protein
MGRLHALDKDGLHEHARISTAHVVRILFM